MLERTEFGRETVTTGSRYEARRRRLLARADVVTLEAPVFPGQDERSTFSLAYARAGADNDGPPLVILPGGPGLGSIVPGRRWRRRAAEAGFQVLMPEHRGVGLSRRLSSGGELPLDAMWMEHAARDVLAVLDHYGAERAWLHGTSYGGYLAQLVAALAPQRILGLFLDSTISAARYDEREQLRSWFWRGELPQTRRIASLVREVAARRLASDDDLALLVPALFELLGPRPVQRLLVRVLGGSRHEWNALVKAITGEGGGEKERPFLFENDLVGAIWFREIYLLEPDGLPFDRAGSFAEERMRLFPFLTERRPFDLDRHLPGFQFPVVVLRGERDARTPGAAVERMRELLPQALFVELRHAGHDLLTFRTRDVLALEAACASGGLTAAGEVAARIAASGPNRIQALSSSAAAAYLSGAELVSSARRRARRHRLRRRQPQCPPPS